MTTIFPWVMSIIGIIGFYLAGKKVWWAWYVNLANQVVWLAYSIGTQQWGFLLATLFYVGVFSKNARTWTREHFGLLPDQRPRWVWWAHRLGVKRSAAGDKEGVPFGWREPNPLKYEDFKIDFNEIAYHRDPDAPLIDYPGPPLTFLNMEPGLDHPLRCESRYVNNSEIICTRQLDHRGAHTGGGKIWYDESSQENPSV